MKHIAITIVLLSLCLMAPAQKPIRHSSSSTTTTTTKPTKTTKPAKKPAAKPARKPAKTTKPARRTTTTSQSSSYSNQSSGYSNQSSGYSNQPSYSSNATVPVPQAVDLGLNVRWASCNLGASRPEDYGYYYRWGETRPYNSGGRSTYTYTGDSKTPLGYSYDAVRANLGGSWRMPNEADVEEMMSKCTREAVTQNGVYGFRVTGPNGNSIFFPASGYHKPDDASLDYNDVLGYSWTSSFGNKTLRFSGSEWGWGYYNSAYGFPIRPVTSSGASSSYSSGSSSYSNQSSYSTTARVPVPRAVDLGLSVKWASFNLGASSQEEYGYYYRWADSDPAGKGMWDTYKYANGSETKLTKYCSDSSKGNNGFTDYKKMLDNGDDAARVNLGGPWRMPTDAEIEELVRRCTHVWTSVNGVKGIRVTGPNGNSIFLPANGCMGSYSTFDTDEKGDYWGSTSTGTEAYDLHFDKTGYWACHSYEYAWGFCIRPVRP